MTAPLTPADADLQDFPFMPLHVARLRDSDLAAEEHPEACWYAVLLWSASWHQLPAGSLPDSDDVLCRLLGLGRDLRTFRKHKVGALRGWVKCDDGRLYHPIVAEQVATAWEGKVRQRHRTFCAAVRKHNERHPDDKHDAPTFEAWQALGCPADIAALVTALSRVTGAGIERDMPSKREGERKGQGQGDSSDADASGGGAPPDPPVDPEKVMFDSGIRLLAESGVTEARARPLLGKWKSQHGAEAVIVALGKAQREGAMDPKAFIEGCLRNGQRRDSDRSGGGWAPRAGMEGFEPASLDDDRPRRAAGQ